MIKEDFLSLDNEDLVYVSVGDLRRFIQRVKGDFQRKVLHVIPQRMNTKEAAELLGKSQMTIVRWRECGYLKGYREGRNWYYRLEDVEACRNGYSHDNTEDLN